MIAHKIHGVTFMEALVTVIIVSILAAVAFPSYEYLVQNYRARTLSTDFSTSLSFTRSEAIKRGTTVTMCAASNNTFTTCGANTAWTNGWIIFVDPNDDGAIANATDRLQVQEALNPTATFVANQARVTFNSRGFLTSGAATFTASAPGCSGNHGRQFTISNVGRVAITQIACP